MAGSHGERYEPLFDDGELQRLVDALFAHAKVVDRDDVLTLADAFDAGKDVLEIVEALPTARYTRVQLTTQLNSTITAHGWSGRIGLVE